MSSTFALQTMVELFCAALLIYGVMNESKVISFEQHTKRILIGNLRRFIRIHKHKRRERNETVF